MKKKNPKKKLSKYSALHGKTVVDIQDNVLIDSKKGIHATPIASLPPNDPFFAAA